MDVSSIPHLTSAARRAVLTSTPNPDPTHDYVIDLSGRVGRADVPEVELCIRYVPSRLTLSTGGMDRYVHVLQDERWSSLEALAITVLDDINTELAPRWVRVTAMRRLNGGNVDQHRVVIEDSEPTWNNPQLLGRVTPG